MLFVCYIFLSETDSWSFGLAGYSFLGNPIGGFMSVNGILQSHWQSLQSPAQKFITGPAHFTSSAVISFMVASRNHSLSLVSVNYLQCLCSSSREIRSKNIDLTQIYFKYNKENVCKKEKTKQHSGLLCQKFNLGYEIVKLLEIFSFCWTSQNFKILN